MQRASLVGSLTILLVWFTAGMARAYPIAEPNVRVYDGAGYMPDIERRALLNQRLLAFERDSHGIQLAVVTVQNTDGKSLEEYANGIFRAWGIGQQGQNNGMLLLISRQADASRNKSRIEVGYGLEDRLTDAQCSRIINDVMIPLARDRHDPQGAIEAAAKEIIIRITGPQTPVRQHHRTTHRRHPVTNDGDEFKAFVIVTGSVFGFVALVVLLFRRMVRRHEEEEAAKRQAYQEYIERIRQELKDNPPPPRPPDPPKTPEELEEERRESKAFWARARREDEAEERRREKERKREQRRRQKEYEDDDDSGSFGGGSFDFGGGSDWGGGGGFGGGDSGGGGASGGFD